jgi:hypothetical protein
MFAISKAGRIYAPQPSMYADDTFLQGAAEPTMRAFQALVNLATPLGLEVQPAKCAVYSVNAAAATSVATQLGVQCA